MPHLSIQIIIICLSCVYATTWFVHINNLLVVVYHDFCSALVPKSPEDMKIPQTQPEHTLITKELC